MDKNFLTIIADRNSISYSIVSFDSKNIKDIINLLESEKQIRNTILASSTKQEADGYKTRLNMTRDSIDSILKIIDYGYHTIKNNANLNNTLTSIKDIVKDNIIPSITKTGLQNLNIMIPTSSENRTSKIYLVILSYLILLPDIKFNMVYTSPSTRSNYQVYPDIEIKQSHKSARYLTKPILIESNSRLVSNLINKEGNPLYNKKELVKICSTILNILFPEIYEPKDPKYRFKTRPFQPIENKS